MSYVVICDSCTDFTPQLRQDTHYKLVPLTLHLGDYDIVDDHTFDQLDFLKRVAEYPECAKSSCPSPDSFMSHFDEGDDVFIVTLSSQLSGSYNSAELAKKMYLEEHPSKNVHVFDSKSASVGQTLIAMKVTQLENQELSFQEIVDQVELFIQEMKTKFVLETLDNLKKNGRLTGMQAIIASALNIKPVMRATSIGSIDKITQARGVKKAIQKMAECVAEDAIHPEEKTLAIVHCNNYERALYTRDEILKSVSFKDVYIAGTAGVSSLYAADGGIIVCY